MVIMACILVQAFPGVSFVNLHLRPSGDSSKTTLYVENKKVLRMTCTERKGMWFLCHTRNASGWVCGKEIISMSFPTVFIVNDELPSEAQIRLRDK